MNTIQLWPDRIPVDSHVDPLNETADDTDPVLGHQKKVSSPKGYSWIRSRSITAATERCISGVETRGRCDSRTPAGTSNSGIFVPRAAAVTPLLQ